VQQTSGFIPADPDKLNRARQLRDELNRAMSKDRDWDRERCFFQG
jgi:hypothetical protein